MGSMIERVKGWIFGGAKKTIPIPVESKTDRQDEDVEEHERQLAALSAAIDPPLAISDIAGAETRCKDLEAFLIALAVDGAGPNLRRLLGNGYFDLGSAYRQMKRVAEAEAAYAKAMGSLESIVQVQRHARFASSQLAACQNHLGLLYMACGPQEKAIAALDDAIRMRRTLATQYPDDCENVVYLGGAICNRAHIARENGEVNAAATLYDEAIATINSVVPDDRAGEREQAMVRALAAAMNNPRWIQLARHFRVNAQNGRQLLPPRMQPVGRKGAAPSAAWKLKR